MRKLLLLLPALGLLVALHVSGHGDGGFESSRVGPGETFTMVFEASGTVSYECEIHAFMSGRIQVEPAAGTPSKHVIAIQDGDAWAFSPEDLRVAVGDEVTWVNDGSEVHQVGGTLPVESKETSGLGLVAVTAVTVGAARARR